MTTEINIDVHLDGTVVCLYTEEVDLRALGPLKVKRASEVEFNEVTQEWEVRSVKAGMHDPLFSNPSRQACLDWERANFDQLL